MPLATAVAAGRPALASSALTSSISTTSPTFITTATCAILATRNAASMGPTTFLASARCPTLLTASISTLPTWLACE